MAETDQLALYRLWRPQKSSLRANCLYPHARALSTNFSHALLFSDTRHGQDIPCKDFSKAINTQSIAAIRVTSAKYVKPPMTAPDEHQQIDATLTSASTI